MSNEKFYFKNYKIRLIWNIIFSIIYKIFINKKISFLKNKYTDNHYLVFLTHTGLITLKKFEIFLERKKMTAKVNNLSP